MPNKREPLTPWRTEYFNAILGDAFTRSGYLQLQWNSRKEY